MRDGVCFRSRAFPASLHFAQSWYGAHSNAGTPPITNCIVERLTACSSSESYGQNKGIVIFDQPGWRRRIGRRGADGFQGRPVQPARA